jgi:hypothetical protein
MRDDSELHHVREDVRALRREVREDVTSLRNELHNSTVRIEETLAATEDRLTKQMWPITNWQIDVEKRLAEHGQMNRLISGVIAAVGSIIVTVIVNAASCDGFRRAPPAQGQHSPAARTTTDYIPAGSGEIVPAGGR